MLKLLSCYVVLIRMRQDNLKPIFKFLKNLFLEDCTFFIWAAIFHKVESLIFFSPDVSDNMFFLYYLDEEN